MRQLKLSAQCELLLVFEPEPQRDIRGAYYSQLLRFVNQAGRCRALNDTQSRLLQTLLIAWIVYREITIPRRGDRLSLNMDSTGGAAVGLSAMKATSSVYNPYADLEDLIMVTGHAVYLQSDYLKAGEEASWYLEDYQLRAGQANTFV